jgi:uncharacterized membrane protein
MPVMLGFIVLVAAIAHLAPHAARPDIFFGVTVHPEFRRRPEGRAIARRYAIETWLLAMVSAALVVTSPMPVVSASMLMAQSFGAFVAFVRARSGVMPHAVEPATIREAELGPRPGLPGGLAAQLGPFLILLAASVFVALNWDAVPPRIPTHWNIAGNPDGWTRKSVSGLFRAPLLGLIVCGLMWFSSFGALHWTRLPRVTGGEGVRSHRVRRINLIATLASEYLVALLIAWTLVTPIWSDGAGRLRLPLAFRVAPFALLIVGALTIRAVRRTAIPNGPAIGDTTPDACWILGRLYINRADPALFVERRIGIGYTLNLGNPASWLVMIVAVVAVSVPLLFMG